MNLRVKWTLSGLAIGLAFLFAALFQADLGASWQVLRKTNWQWASLAFVAALAFMAVKTWRWSRILGPLVETGFGVLQSAVYIGTAANLIVSHTGEILRSTLLARREKVASGAVLATVAVERIFDFVALLAMIGIALVWDPAVSPLLVSAGLLTLALVVIGVLGMLAFLYPTPLLRRLGYGALSLIPERARTWVVHHLQRGISGLGAIRSPSLALRAFGLSMLQWAFIVVAVWASAKAVGVSVPLLAAMTVFVLTVIGLTLPSPPAQVGTTQVAFVVGLEFFGVAPATAFAASWVYTCFVVVSMMLLGALCWMVSDWSPSGRRGTAA